MFVSVGFFGVLYPFKEISLNINYMCLGKGY